MLCSMSAGMGMYQNEEMRRSTSSAASTEGAEVDLPRTLSTAVSGTNVGSVHIRPPCIRTDKAAGALVLVAG